MHMPPEAFMKMHIPPETDLLMTFSLFCVHPSARNLFTHSGIVQSINLLTY